MIAQLTGSVAEVFAGHVIIDVGGIGYLVAVRNPLDFKKDADVSLYTYLAVRENALDLYGFEALEERKVFELLLRVPKIGPKSAMQILTQADIELLKRSVASDDPTYLSKMSGIGKKSAEKIVVGLKGIFDEYVEDGRITTTRTGDSDVVDALITLGYSQKDAREALAKLPIELTETNERVKEALKQLGK